ncbi:unnamed protein product [Scytosiphon promiscuus]
MDHQPPDGSGSVDEQPFVSVSDKMPYSPSSSGGLPSGEVTTTAPNVSVKCGDASSAAGLSARSAAAVGAIGSAIGLSGDKPDAEMPCSANGDVSVPDFPSRDVRKPKKGIFGGLFGSSKMKMETESPDVDISLPEVTGSSVSAKGGDASSAVGLTAGGAAAVGAIGSAISLSGDKPDAEVPFGVVHSHVFVPDSSARDVQKPKKGMFGSVFASSTTKRETEEPFGRVNVSVAVPASRSVDERKPKKGMFGSIFGSSKSKAVIEESSGGVVVNVSVPADIAEGPGEEQLFSALLWRHESSAATPTSDRDMGRCIVTAREKGVGTKNMVFRAKAGETVRRPRRPVLSWTTWRIKFIQRMLGTSSLCEGGPHNKRP